MSGKAVGWAALQQIGDPRRKLVLMLLAEHHNEKTGRCDPGQERLAILTECSVKTVHRLLAKLESAGFLRRQKRGGNGNGRQSDQYELALDRLSELKAKLPDRAMSLSHGEANGQIEGGLTDKSEVANGHSYVPSNRTQLCPPNRNLNRKKEPEEREKERERTQRVERAEIEGSRKDDPKDHSSLPTNSSYPTNSSLPTPQSPPPVFEGRRLVVTPALHAIWQRMYPSADLASLYPIVDADCAEKGKTNGAAVDWAQKKLGFLIKDEMREAQRHGKYVGPIMPPWELPASVTGDAREDAIDAYFATMPGYTGRR